MLNHLGKFLPNLVEKTAFERSPAEKEYVDTGRATTEGF